MVFVDDINQNGNVTLKFNQELIAPSLGDDQRRLEENIDAKSIVDVSFDSEEEHI